MLLVAGAAIGSLTFIPALRSIPRWIRVAQCFIGITFVAGGLLFFALYWAGSRISPDLHRFLFFHIVLLAGMGLGVVLFVLVSGEYFKALRALDAARKERLSAMTDGDANENV